MGNVRNMSYAKIFNAVALFAIFFAFAFVFDLNNNAFAQLPAIIIFDNAQYPDNMYFVDHGMFIKVHYNSLPSPPPNSINVRVTSTTDSNGIELPFLPIAGTTDYALSTSYIYFKQTNCPPSDSTEKPAICVSSQLTDTITITASDASGTTIATGTTDVRSSDFGTFPTTFGPQPNALATPACSTNYAYDGICDEWKINLPGVFTGLEIPYGTSGIKYKLSCNAADPLNQCPIPGSPPSGTKDVYLEIDYMRGHAPDLTALQNIVNAFNSKGIKLHIQVDEEIPYHKDSITPPSVGNAGDTDWDKLKKKYFGTVCDRNEQSCPTFDPTLTSQQISDRLTAKRFAFHYAIFTHSQPSGASGASETPGQDIDISLGKWAGGVGSRDQQAGTLMHELGHNLNLLHGGGNSINCKPNYPSVMSYTFQMPTYLGSFWKLDYSNGRLNGLYEWSLSEQTGLWSEQPPAELLTFFYTGNGFLFAWTGGPVNWNGDGSIAGTPSIDVNNLNIGGCTSSPSQVLTDYNDWYYLGLNMWNPYWVTSSIQDGGGAGEPSIDPYWYLIIALLIIIAILAILLVRKRRRGGVAG